MNWLSVDSQIPAINSDIIFHIAGFGISNTILAEFGIILFLAVVTIILFRKVSLNPGSFQNFLEVIYEYLLNLVGQVTGHSAVTKRIFPLVATLFIYVLASNLYGLIPGINEFTWNGIPLFRQPTTDFNVTFGLAVAMVIIIQIVNVLDFGVWGWVGKYVQVHTVWKGFKNGIGAGFLSLVEFGIGLLDITGEVAKTVSLSLRLFGNMYAGAVLMAVAMGAVAYIVPVALFSLSLLSAIVQTLVFSLLVAAFLTMSVSPPDDSVEGEEMESFNNNK